MQRRRTSNIYLRVPERGEDSKPEFTFEERAAEHFPELIKDRGRNGEWFGERGENAGEERETQLIEDG